MGIGLRPALVIGYRLLAMKMEMENRADRVVLGGEGMMVCSGSERWASVHPTPGKHHNIELGISRFSWLCGGYTSWHSEIHPSVR